VSGKGILFDFDGTLVPNLDLADMRRQIAEMAAAAGVPDDVHAGLYIVEIIEASQAWLLEQHGGEASLSNQYAADSHQRIHDIEMQAAGKTRLFDDARRVLIQLRSADYRLGIVTRNCREAVMTMFPDMNEYIDCLHARDDVEYLKPNPRHLQANLDALGADPALSVMVGDGALDMQAGRELNMRCIGVLTGSNDTEALGAAGADEVLADYRGLVNLLT
jgi:phosphoglycolate phosphatase